jgi:hypothetical protein
MSTDLVKSSLQLKFEIKNSKAELSSLQKNWKKKNNASLARILNFRAELKELDAVMAATEEGYKAYYGKLKPFQDFINTPGQSLNKATADLEKVNPALAILFNQLFQQAQSKNSDTEETETARVNLARALHQTATDHILRKSKEIYAALKEEKKNVADYSARLIKNIQEKEEQLQLQIKTDGIGMGL